MSLGTRLFTWLNGELVGSDAYGNRYYRDKRKRTLRRGDGFFSRERRWVIYVGEADASKVPPEWHGWLHHTVNVLPSKEAQRRPWQKDHQPNLTGTAQAYRPPGATAGAGRPKATGDYEAWVP